MRISDWSSDVCSSDLLHQRCTAAGPRYRLVWFVRAKRRRRPAHAPRISELAGQLAADHVGPRQLRPGGIHLQPCEDQWAHRCRLERVRIQRIGRSEEHTTELQSLMRNSYAVFCLKTKNKSMTHTPPDTQLTKH